MADEPSMNDLMRGAHGSDRRRRERSLTDRLARQPDPGAREDHDKDDDNRARDRAQRSDA